jgi:hypothetical protein
MLHAASVRKLLAEVRQLERAFDSDIFPKQADALYDEGLPLRQIVNSCQSDGFADRPSIGIVHLYINFLEVSGEIFQVY